MVGPLKLTRDQIAAFVPDFQTLKQLENLFGQVNTSIATLEELAVQVGNAQASANDALAQLQGIMQALSVEALAPQPASVEEIARVEESVQALAVAPAQREDTSITTDYIDMPVFAPGAKKARRLQWSEDSGTFIGGIPGHSVRMGFEALYLAKNATGGGVTPGTPVMISGASSGQIEFAKADAGVITNADAMMGVVTASIANGGSGYVTQFGPVSGFDTSGLPYGESWSAGDLLYFRPSAAGQWTNVKPTSGINAAVAVVVTVDGTDGLIWVFMRPGVGSSIFNTAGVSITGPAGGQLLIYNASASAFVNAGLTAGAGIAIIPSDGAIQVETTGFSGSFGASGGETVTVHEGIITSVV